jgi:hypothetical protein
LKKLTKEQKRDIRPSRQKKTKTFDFSDAGAALDSSTLPRFFPRSPGHIKTLGLKQMLIYLQSHILALPETRSLALFCLWDRPPCFGSVKAIRPKRIRTGRGQ